MIQQLSDQKLNALVKDFKEYKLMGSALVHFSRDVIYDNLSTLQII